MRIVLSLLVAVSLSVLVPTASSSAAPACTIRGSDRDEALTGTAGRDVICGFGGDDYIWGKGGNDVILAGSGDDLVLGNYGNDTIVGGPGADRLTGDYGNDTVRGGEGPDVLLGGPGADRVLGDPGADEMQGGNGNDLLDGGRGNDIVSGENQDDTVRGGDGNDRLGGAGGRNVLSGGDGEDILVAADGGSDRLFGGADGDDLIGSGPDQLSGGDGADYCPRKDGSSCGIEEDQQQPRVLGVWVSPARLDLSESRDATLGARVVDDLGLRLVEIWAERDGVRLPLRRRSNLSGLRLDTTTRNGVWRLVGRATDDAQPGTYRVWLKLVDRADNSRLIRSSRTITVVR